MKIWTFIRSRPYALYLARFIRRVSRCVNDTIFLMMSMCGLGIIVGMISFMYETSPMGLHGDLSFADGVIQCGMRGLWVAGILMSLVYIVWEIWQILGGMRRWADNYYSQATNKQDDRQRRY